jgi:hypothetical protein
MKREKLAAVFSAAAMVLGLAASASAVDGTIEINQAKVLANGGSFPSTIGASGSYRLTGNLTVPANTDGILVLAAAANSTIDLNGFSITGPGSSSNTQTGIDALNSNDVTVENGAVTGFGFGVVLAHFGIVRNVHADMNGSGMQVGNNSVVQGCTANDSTQSGSGGIRCGGDGCVISGNTVNGSPLNTNARGIVCDGSGSLISGNTILGNSAFGLVADPTTGYGENVLSGNGTNVFSGTSMKNNVCTSGGTTSTC